MTGDPRGRIAAVVEPGEAGMSLATGGRSVETWIGRAAELARTSRDPTAAAAGSPTDGGRPSGQDRERQVDMPPFTAEVEHTGSHAAVPGDLTLLLRRLGPLERIEVISRFATSRQVELRLLIAHALRHVPPTVGSVSAIEHLCHDEVFAVRAVAATTARLRLHDAPERLRAVLAKF